MATAPAAPSGPGIVPAVTDDDLAEWLRLLLVPGVGRATARQLLQAFGSPRDVVRADPQALRTAVGDVLASAIEREPADWSRQTDATLRWRAEGPDRHLIPMGHPGYPDQLLESPDPPLLLLVRGSVEVLSAAAIAVVGSRRPTAQGRDHAHRFAEAFSEAGWVVVSGLATGVDGAAHEGSLAGPGSTVAVIGTGPDRVYPPRHLALARRVAERGAVVSEYLPGTPPLPEHFPQRNRIIAGLARGTLVVEAALQSGSLITARLSNEAGREVFAIPGSILSEQSRGCHALIREGALLVESPEEVLDTLAQPVLFGSMAAARAGARVARPPDEAAPPGRPDALLEALGHAPTTLDELQARTGEPTGALLARLMQLELEGRVAALPGGLYQRRGLA